MDVKQDISTVMTVDVAVQPILDRSCNDCHSNRTVWPWYSEIAPISWLVASDVSDGRRHMNFSEWGTYPGYKREDLLNEACRIVTERDMPLLTYVITHREGRLSDSDREAVCRWTKANTEKK